MVTLSRSEAVDLLKSEKGKFGDFNPLTLKIWLSILPASGYKFTCKLVRTIWW